MFGGSVFDVLGNDNPAAGGGGSIFSNQAEAPQSQESRFTGPAAYRVDQSAQGGAQTSFNVRGSNYGSLNVLDKMRGVQANRLNADSGEVTLEEAYGDSSLDTRVMGGMYNVTITDIYSDRTKFEAFYGLHTDGMVVEKESSHVDADTGIASNSGFGSGTVIGGHAIAKHFLPESPESRYEESNKINSPKELDSPIDRGVSPFDKSTSNNKEEKRSAFDNNQNKTNEKENNKTLSPFDKSTKKEDTQKNSPFEKNSSQKSSPFGKNPTQKSSPFGKQGEEEEENTGILGKYSKSKEQIEKEEAQVKKEESDKKREEKLNKVYYVTDSSKEEQEANNEEAKSNFSPRSTTKNYITDQELEEQNLLDQQDSTTIEKKAILITSGSKGIYDKNDDKEIEREIRRILEKMTFDTVAAFVRKLSQKEGKTKKEELKLSIAKSILIEKQRASFLK